MYQYIHLLYVPTMACNMQCRYCYLEDNTVDLGGEHSPLETLRYAVEKCRAEGIVPFNISLHGGEVTTLSPACFRELIDYIARYYRDNRDLLTGAGFNVGTPHIKTNLYGLDRHLDTIRDYGVSVSGSLDLPFSLHERYRVTKTGDGTLEKILKNIEAMRAMPNRKKVSATIFREHFQRTDEIIRDIRFLHENSCLDMLDFNFMVGFDYNSNGLLHAMNGEEQLSFFQQIYDAFAGSELDAGLRGAWFKEFGPDYCTNCTNCGEKFFLLEKNGDVYSCVRGQKQSEFYYGNIYRSSMKEIMETAAEKIRLAHAACGFDDECASCGYLSVCKTGCPFVKRSAGSSKSYTCLLQKKLYALWGIEKDPYNEENVVDYLCRMHPERAEDFALPRVPHGAPSLQSIIRSDARLQGVYDPEAFVLQIDGQDFPLESQLLKHSRPYAFLTPESRVTLYIKAGLFDLACDYPANNALYIQLLTGDMIVYGDEGRWKQRHIANEMIYKQVVEEQGSDRPGYLRADLTRFFAQYGPFLSAEEANNVFFTTSALRDYHYTKQKNNAFYHMQAMDLPFPNLEFYYVTREAFYHVFSEELQ